jgi:5-methylcytosine-specific restriction enzyme A
MTKLTMLKPRVQNLSRSKVPTLPRWQDPGRGTTTERGYGYAWQKLRIRILERDHGLCQVCAAQGRVSIARDVDHIVNKAQGGTDAESNLQAICPPCHTAKTARESRGLGG